MLYSMSLDYIDVTAGLYTEGVSWCASLNGDYLSWPAVQQYLQNQPAILRSFTDLGYVGQERFSDIRLARKAGGFAYEYWCSGGDLKDVELLLQHFNVMAGDCHWIDPSGKLFFFPSYCPLSAGEQSLLVPGAVTTGLLPREILCEEVSKDANHCLHLSQRTNTGLFPIESPKTFETISTR